MGKKEPCYVLGEQIIKDRPPFFWLFKMACVPRIGERITEGDPGLGNLDDVAFKVRLVVAERRLVCLIDGLRAFDGIADMGGEINVTFISLLAGLVSGKRKL